ncbi:tRNA-binding protein [bacterium]|nr:tRNA-binding protein [bacterium]
MELISIDDFKKLDIRTGKIIKADDFPKAKKPAYQLTIDFGPLGTKRSSAQLTKLYTKESLLNRTVLAVVNFTPRKIADFESEVLVLGIVTEDNAVVLLQPEADIALGSSVS